MSDWDEQCKHENRFSKITWTELKKLSDSELDIVEKLASTYHSYWDNNIGELLEGDVNDSKINAFFESMQKMKEDAEKFEKLVEREKKTRSNEFKAVEAYNKMTKSALKFTELIKNRVRGNVWASNKQAVKRQQKTMEKARNRFQVAVKLPFEVKGKLDIAAHNNDDLLTEEDLESSFSSQDDKSDEEEFGTMEGEGDEIEEEEQEEKEEKEKEEEDEAKEKEVEVEEEIFI